MCDRRECAELKAQLEAKIEQLQKELEGAKKGKFYCKICPEKKSKPLASVYVMERHLTQKVSLNIYKSYSNINLALSIFRVA